MILKKLTLLTSADWQDYELLDSGNYRKLERFGPFRFVRPEPQAMWLPRLSTDGWAADGIFQPNKSDFGNYESGGWKLDKSLPKSWPMTYQNLQFLARPTPFRHLGFFPEQAAHWNWCAHAIKQFTNQHKRPPRILNLFAYSGLATLHAAAAGAEVTHLDASKKAVAQAFENRDLNGMQDRPVRFIVDDAPTFVAREIRRQRSYDGIIMDPPKYGRGPKGETWRIEEDLMPLLDQVTKLLSPQASFIVITIYAIRSSSLAAHYALADVLDDRPGEVESGELALHESPIPSQPKMRYVVQANFARWRAP